MEEKNVNYEVIPEDATIECMSVDLADVNETTEHKCECGGNCGENCKCHHNHDCSEDDSIESSVEERPDPTATEIHLKTLNGDVFVIDGMDVDWNSMIENTHNMISNIDMLRSMMRDLTNDPDNNELAIVIHDQITKFMDGFGIELKYDNVKKCMSIYESAKCMCFDAITIAYELLNVTNAQMIMNRCTQLIGEDPAMDLSTMLPKGWRLEPVDDETMTEEDEVASMFGVFNVKMYERDYTTTELGMDQSHDAVLDTVFSDSDEDGAFLEVNLIATDSDDAITRAEAVFEEYYEQQKTNKEDTE